MRQQVPGEQDNTDRNHPGAGNGVHREQTLFGFVGDCTTGGQAAVFSTGAWAGTDISVPKIEFKHTPATAFPTATGGAAAVGGGFHDLGDRWFGTSTKQQYG